MSYRQWNLTEEEIVRELEKALEGADDPREGHTVFELAKLMEISPGAVRIRLSALKELGRLEVVKVRRINLAGKPQARTAYRILPAPNATSDG